jgi:hypothetical protein
LTLGLTLTPLPAFDDNYLWLLDNGREALVVDPGDAAPVAAALDARGLTLAGILLTTTTAITSAASMRCARACGGPSTRPSASGCPSR